MEPTRQTIEAATFNEALTAASEWLHEQGAYQEEADQATISLVSTAAGWIAEVTLWK